MQMSEKKYADYSQDLYNESVHFIELDTIEAQKIIRQVEEVAKKTGKIEWKLQVSYLECKLFAMKRDLYGNNLFPVEKSVEMEKNLLEKAEKFNVKQVELSVRQGIINYYWEVYKNYEMAFELYSIQEKRLEQVSLDEIPEKLDYLIVIANAHYYFKDYSQAIHNYNIMLKEKDNSRTSNPKQHALNGLGLSYRNGYKDLDRSDSCFLAIKQPENINLLENDYYREIWDGIAEGNLGYNMLLRNEFDKAIPLLKNSLEKLLKHGDFGFSTGTAINLANVYLKKGNMPESKHYIDLAVECYNKIPRDGMLSRIYEAYSKYYITTGNVKSSLEYMDSTLVENKKYEEQYSALRMMRVKQRQHIAEQKLKEEQLKVEKIRSAGYRRSLIISISALILIGFGLARYFILYRKKKSAYRELVRKSQDWAHVNAAVPASNEVEIEIENEPENVIESEIQEKHNVPPDDVDLLIMKEIENLILEEKLYRDTSLSVDLLANKLGAKRYNVSIAINRCMKKSFNTYINEFRIKEAIQILSKNSVNAIKIDTVAFDVGFNDRHNFYRVFKKITGLSPTEFQKSLSQ